MTPVLRAIDPRLREAAAMLGASPARVWREVDLPIVGPRARSWRPGSRSRSRSASSARRSSSRGPTRPTLPVRDLPPARPARRLELRRGDGRERDPDGADRGRRSSPIERFRVGDGRRVLMLAVEQARGALRRPSPRVDGVDLDGRRRRDRVRARAERERQEHAAARRRRARARRRPGGSCAGTARPRRRPAASPRLRPHVPGPRAVPASRRARQRGVRAAHAAACRGPRPSDGRGRCSRSSASRASSTAAVARALGRRAAARRARPGARARAAAPHARRAARRARPRAA